MTVMPTPAATAATAADWYAGYSGFTSVRRSQTAAKAEMPTHGRPGHTIVALHGELDIASAPALREHLLGTLQHSARLLILDLGEVSFCDATGLAVLIGLQRRATGLGVTLQLANVRPQVAKLLRITGLNRSLSVQSASTQSASTQSPRPEPALRA
ncbi:STAS domain-containing protein [Spirillospora sp. CA-255316]